jgi:hypothetical protein
LQQLDFEIPLARDSSSDLMGLLERVQVLHLLRLDTKGYLLICRMSNLEWSTYRKSLPPIRLRKMSVKLLGKEKSGNALLQVEGLWLGVHERRDPQAFEFFRAMEKAPLFGLGNPTIDAKAIRFSIVAESRKIKELLNGLEKFDVAYKVHNLSRLRARNQSLLNDLTTQQTRVLRLAHTLGYYEIPRRQRTEDLARILDMDTATVGEHLRRAEKHVFDELLGQSYLLK